MTRRRFEVGESVDLYVPGRTVEAVIRAITADGYRVAVRTRRGWSARTRRIDHGDNYSGPFVAPVRETPTDEQRRSARVAVDRAIAATLRDVPCFCTPERPELGRPDYCLKHIVLARLDRDALAEGVQQALGVGG